MTTKIDELTERFILSETPTCPPPDDKGECAECSGDVDPIWTIFGWKIQPLCVECLERKQRLQVTHAKRKLLHLHALQAGISEYEIAQAKEVKFAGLGKPVRDIIELVEPARKCAAYLCGPAGTGKTTQLVLATLNRIVNRLEQFSDDRITGGHITQGGIVYITEGEFLRARYPGPDQRPLSDFTEAPFLALDEIGGSKPTDFAGAEIYDLINARYRHRRPTLFAGNFRLSQLARSEKQGGHRCYDDRLITRIGEMCGADSAQDYGAAQTVLDYSYRLKSKVKFGD
jgi:DNA replication protein DnaC